MNLSQNYTFRSLLIPLLFLAFSSAQAIEIDIIPMGILVTGEIVAGDADKVAAAFVEAYNRILTEPDSPSSYPESVEKLLIGGPGGNLTEAMKIGELVRSAHMVTYAYKTCASACFFVVVAGLERFTQGSQIGLHRPRFSKETYRNWAPSEGVSNQEKLESQAREYLMKMDVPVDLIDEMFSISSVDVKFVDGSSIQNRMGITPSGLGEWYAANCGALTLDERRDLEIFDSVESCATFRKVYEITGSNDPDPSWCASSERQKRALSEGYWTYLDAKRDKIEACAFRPRTQARLKTYFKYCGDNCFKN